MAAIDIVTLADTKAVLGFATTNTSKDVAITRIITAVSKKFDECFGPTITRSVTSERYDGGLPAIELRQSPMTAVTSVIEYQDTNPVVLTEEQPGIQPTEGWVGDRYDPEPLLYSGIIRRRINSCDSWFWQGRGNIVVSYTAGRSTTTATVEPRIQEAFFLTMRNWWRSYEQNVAGYDEFEVPHQNFPTYALPRAAVMLLSDLYQPGVGFG